jgi:hypothetical protein
MMFFHFPFFQREKNRQISKKTNFFSHFSFFKGRISCTSFLHGFQKRNNLSQIPCLSLKKKKHRNLKRKLPTIYKRVLQSLYIHIFEYRQIWLNSLQTMAI